MNLKFLRANRKANLIDSSDPTLGITSSSVKIIDDTMVCSFTRQNSNANVNYFSLSKSNLHYLIAAYGRLSTNGGKKKDFSLIISKYQTLKKKSKQVIQKHTKHYSSSTNISI